MKHLIIEKDAYSGTLHRTRGFYWQNMRSQISAIHAKGLDLVDVTDAQIAQYQGVDVFSKQENMYAYNSATNALEVVANPEWPYPEE